MGLHRGTLYSIVTQKSATKKTPLWHIEPLLLHPEDSVQDPCLLKLEAPSLPVIMLLSSD